MAFTTVQLTERHRHVDLATGSEDMVAVTIGDTEEGVILVGSRYEVHRLIIEADRQLGRLAYR